MQPRCSEIQVAASDVFVTKARVVFDRLCAEAVSGLCSNARSVVSCYLVGRKLYAVHLAQTSDHLSVSWAAGDSNLLPGSGVHRRRSRQLDHTRFQGLILWAYITLLAIDVALSSSGIVSFPKSGALRIHSWSMVLSVILLVAGFVF
jgi:hypothetical protein